MVQQFNLIPGNNQINLPPTVGTATLVLGTVTVSLASVTAQSIIFLTAQNGGVLAGIVRVSNINPGVGFTILSTILTDTAVIGFLVF